MYYSENGDEIKKFCVYDGMAFKILQNLGYKVGIITTEDMNLNKIMQLFYNFILIRSYMSIIKKISNGNSIIWIWKIEESTDELSI